MDSQKSCALLLVVVAALYMELYHAQGLQGRCSCPVTMKFVKGNISDFQVLEKRPGCDHEELIVTLKRPNSTEHICMNTGGQRAKAFLRCWGRINKDERRKPECIERQKQLE